MLFSLAKNDFKSKYAGSALGTVWAFISPVITILIYWFVFQVAFHNGDTDGVPYVVWLVSGIVPWFFVSEAWGGATGVLADYSYLVKKVVFPVEILPMVRVVSAFFVHLFFVLLAFIVTLVFDFTFKLVFLQIFFYMLMAFLLAYALGRITSVLMAFTKDTNNIVGIIVQFGFWLTPIFWNINDGGIPEKIKWIFYINPFYYVVQGYRDTFVYNVWFWQKPWLTLYFVALVGVLLIVGNLLFKKLRPHLADLL